MKSQSTFNCISLTAKNVKHFFQVFLSCFFFNLLGTLVPSIIFVTGFFVSLVLGFLSDLYILDTSLLSNVVLVSVP